MYTHLQGGDTCYLMKVDTEAVALSKVGWRVSCATFSGETLAFLKGTIEVKALDMESPR